MGNKVTCTCGHSWNKSDSSKKDATVCHICGKDNEMENGGWLDKYEQGGMVLKQKTNDNYGKKDNPNDVKVSVGDDYVGLAYDTTGRNYSPAWGGQFAMGGTIPGSVGFTYARTGNTPSEGPYAKKTVPSAQNGQEMQYYQEGLDFKPKNISRNGGWLDAYDVPKAEDGIETGCPVGYYKDANGNCVSLTSRNQQQAVSDETRVAKRDYEGERALRLRQFIANQPQFKQGKDETQYEAEVRKLKNKGAVAKNPNAVVNTQGDIVPKYADTDVKGRVIDRQANTQRRIQNTAAAVASPFVGAASVMGAGAAGAATIPYIAPALNAPLLGTFGSQYGTAAITGQNLLGLGFGLKGASNLGGDVDSGYYSSDAPLSEKVDRGLITAMDMAFSPGVTKAIGMGYGATKNALITSTEKGLLSNAYKLNPYAERLNDANKSYRVAGLDALEDFQNTGVLRSVQQGVPEGASLTERLMSRPTGFPSFQKGYADMRYAPKEGAAVFETALPTFKRGEINPVTGFPIKGRHYAHRVIDPETGATMSEIPGANIKVFGGKPHWLQGYKQVEVPKPASISSSVDDVGNTFSKNPLTDKEKEMYQWFDEQMRFDKLPQTTNKQSIDVLNNFKQRIRTPEGQKRLKELGITEEQLLQDLKIVEDPNTYGYYRGDKNAIAMNPNHPLPKKVVRHEIEHGVQNALRKSKINKVIDGTPAEKLKALESTTTEIDDILSGLTLRREGTPNKIWGNINTKEVVDINNYKSLINNRQNATDYFLTGSEGREKSAFLGEVQQYMMETGKIPKNSYVEVTPEMVKETMIDAMFDEAGGGKYLRLFNIIKADPKNYDLISKGLNKMLTVTPIIGGALTYKTLQGQEETPEYKQGGIIKDDRGQWDHPGEITRIKGGNITMKPDPKTGKSLNEPLLGIADTGEEQMMYPGQEYEFEGAEYVTEYPKGKRPKKAKNGVNQADENSLVQLDQLTNFTNYNKPTKGGWLDKY